MRLRFWQKLFLLNALLIVLAIAGVLAVQQRAFRSGLLDYVNSLDRERVAALAPRFAQAYARDGSWEFLRRRPGLFLNLVNARDEFGDGAMDGPRRGFPRRGPRGGRFGPPGGRPDDGLGPRFEGGLADEPFGPPGGRPGDGQGPRFGDGPPGPRGGGPTELAGRLLLLDAAGVPVLDPARPVPQGQRVAIDVEGSTVGFLVLAPQPMLTDRAELTFARDQRRGAALAGVVGLLIALALAFAVGRRLLAPLAQVTHGARRLVAGDYAVRLPVTRGDEIGALGADFNLLAEALASQRDAQRHWIADLSHELRTPLAILRGEIHALEDGVRPLEREALVSLRAEVERLTALVEDLYQLSLSDLGALAYRFEPADLGAVLREVVDSRAVPLRAAGLALELGNLPAAMPVRADERRLVQLFDNLLGNSMRYTDRGGRVAIAAARSASGWIVHVDDTAPGVPREALPRLFDRLYRVESSRNRAAGGAGLGLAIARNIVEAHGGTIVAEASPLGGLRIAVTLPIAESRR